MNSASSRAGRCKYSQFQHLTDCARQHISPTTSETHDFKTTPATKGLALCCLDATLVIKAHRWVPVNTHGTPMSAREGLGEAQQHHNSTTRLRHFAGHRSTFVKHLHINCFLTDATTVVCVDVLLNRALGDVRSGGTSCVASRVVFCAVSGTVNCAPSLLLLFFLFLSLCRMNVVSVLLPVTCVCDSC